MVAGYENKLENIEEQYKTVVNAESEVKAQLNELLNKETQEKARKDWKDNQIREIDKRFSALIKDRFKIQKAVEALQQELRDLQRQRERIVEESNVKVMLARQQ